MCSIGFRDDTFDDGFHQALRKKCPVLSPIEAMESNKRVEESNINTMPGDRAPKMSKKEKVREIKQIEWQVVDRDEGCAKGGTSQRMLHPIVAIVVQL